MDATWILTDTPPEAILAWLRELAELARAEQRANPHRSRTPIAGSGEVAPAALPLRARASASRAGAIYRRLPSPAEPFGNLLLLAVMEEAGARSLRVEMASDPAFPLYGDEIVWHFTHRFPRHMRGASGRRTGMLMRVNHPDRSSHTGAPVLACNVWLEEQLARLPDSKDPAARRRLFRPWLERYVRLRGVEPVDAKRSFRAALLACELRLRRRRESSHGRARAGWHR